MSKIILVFFVLFYSGFALVHSCQATPNLAKGKQYSVSPQPNYLLSASHTDKTALTDGKYTIGHFWTQKSTVGWQRTKYVEILIDLEKESNIGSIVFNSARGEEAGVYYPAHITTFVGPDLGHLSYVGDIAAIPDNLPGSYQIRQFVLNDIGARGRYILLEVEVKGDYLFCDEIEVFEESIGSGKMSNFTVEQARTYAEQLRRTDIEKVFLKRLAESLKEEISVQPEAERLEEIKRHIASLETALGAKAVEGELLSLRRATLSARFPGEYVHIQGVSTWSPLNSVLSPSSGVPAAMSLIAPCGGHDSGGIMVTNLSVVPQHFSIALDNVIGGANLFIYNVPFVKTAAMEQVADPLVPVEKGLTLRSGESRVFIVSAHGTHPGKWRTTLRVNSDSTITSIPIAIQVVNVPLQKNLTLNSVNWAYLDFKLIRGRQESAVKDLLAHHTNVIVVPPSYLPVGELSPDFDRLDQYMKTIKGISKIILFLDFGSVARSSVNGKYPFMGSEWKVWFKTWYRELTKTTVNAGISKDNIYFYPYDEMDGRQIDDFITFATWARKELSEIRLYATINKSALRTLSYLDVAQVGENEELLRDLVATKTEIWIYRAKGPAKSNSPYSYYRLMAWRAFLYGCKGIGFWAYADSGDSGTAWDDFDGKNPDYAVIYEGPNNTIISSRRWEAWRMGIEDYELLTMYAKAKGEGVAKALAKSVLDNPQDTSKADEVRKKILLELE